jgi:hypothetical protein
MTAELRVCSCAEGECHGDDEARRYGYRCREVPLASNERMAVLARFIRNQISLADRPPPGCIQLNNDEAAVCAEALERVTAETAGKPLLEQFHDMLHRDQTGLSNGLEAVLKTVSGFRWATESRGCYEWDDDRFHGEMKNMLDAIQKSAQDALDAWKRGPLPCCVLERSRVKTSLKPLRREDYPNHSCSDPACEWCCTDTTSALPCVWRDGCRNPTACAAKGHCDAPLDYAREHHELAQGLSDTRAIES